MGVYLSTVVPLPIKETSSETLTIVPKQKSGDIPDLLVVYLSENAFQQISRNFYKVTVRAVCTQNHDCLLNAKKIVGTRLANIESEGEKMIISVAPSQEKLVPRDIATAELVLATNTGEESIGFLKNVGILKPEAYRRLQEMYVGFLQQTKKMIDERKSADNVGAKPKVVKA